MHGLQKLYRMQKGGGGLIEEISIQEEVEQDLINKSVAVDIEKRTCTAKLPFYCRSGF